MSVEAGVRTLTLGIVAVLAAAACTAAVRASPAPSSPPAVLEGRTFLSTAVTENGKDRPLVANTRIRLAFAAGRISAQAGCNMMGGGYAVTGGRLVVTQLATTEMGCDGPRHEQDAWLATLLGSNPRVTLDGSNLILEAGPPTTSIVLLDREVAEPDLPLVGPTWTVDTLIDGDVASSVPGGRPATLVFAGDGRVQVDTGCNAGAGSYTADASAGTIRFSAIGLTKRACQDDVGRLESALLAVLGSDSVTYRIEASRLELRAGTRAVQLRGGEAGKP